MAPLTTDGKSLILLMPLTVHQDTWPLQGRCYPMLAPCPDRITKEHAKKKKIIKKFPRPVTFYKKAGLGLAVFYIIKYKIYISYKFLYLLYKKLYILHKILYLLYKNLYILYKILYLITSTYGNTQ